jgi:maltooligosyltrehalose trehalohydrolase
VARLGAVVAGDTTTFRVWAPAARRVDVVLRDRVVPMAPEPDGGFAVTTHAAAGERYRFRLDGDLALPDPMSRAQPDGVRGPSQIVDPSQFRWTGADRLGLRLDTLAVYEIHVGTFSREGTFDGVGAHLAGLAELGVTAIELMPVATFPGVRGWGYDGLYTSAPHPTYGGPDGLARLVDAAHTIGIGVLIDVVYNHLGPGSETLGAFGPYTTDAHHTLWGGAIDYARPAVREWAIQNAESWVRDYHVDGLRLDAVNAIYDDGEPHVMEELADRVRAVDRRTLIISETDTADTRPIERWGHDAQWGDALHHAVHVLLTGEHDGYYADYGKVADVARELERPDARRLVVCAQNHDQIGNRALGDRQRGRKLRLAAFCAILAPGVPLLFMGEEYDERHPFLFFTDHLDPAIATATREGRRREFERFAAFAGTDVPDPQAAETFVRSKLDRSQGDPAHRDYYRWLLARRRTLPAAPVETIVDEDARFLEVRRGGVVLKMNFSGVERDGVPPWEGVVR